MLDVTAVFSAVSDLAKLGKPILDEAVAQKHEAALRDRLRKFQDILSEPDSADRASALSAFVGELCADTGHPFASMAGGNTIDIPVEAFTALVSIAAEAVKFRADLARIQFKQA